MTTTEGLRLRKGDRVRSKDTGVSGTVVRPAHTPLPDYGMQVVVETDGGDEQAWWVCATDRLVGVSGRTQWTR